MLKSIEIKKDLQDLQNQIKELFDKGENVPQDLLDKLDDKKDEYMKIMEKEIELKEEKEQRNVDKELHYDDVPIEQMSSVNVPGANNGNTGDDKTIKVPSTCTIIL